MSSSRARFRRCKTSLKNYNNSSHLTLTHRQANTLNRIEQGSANYSLCARSSLLSVFVNKDFLETRPYSFI